MLAVKHGQPKHHRSLVHEGCGMMQDDQDAWRDNPFESNALGSNAVILETDRLADLDARMQAFQSERILRTTFQDHRCSFQISGICTMTMQATVCSLSVCFAS